jgi:hypothetical protein
MCVDGEFGGTGRSELDYTIRRSQRARHVWLRFTGSGELVVVVPRRFDMRRVPGVVESNREWIQRAEARVAARRVASAQADPCALPDRIHLSATGGEWTVEYRATGAFRVTAVARPDDRLVVTGATGDVEACRAALVRWLYRVARTHLVTRLRETAAEAGFTVGRIAIRSQSTRWASCSRQATINLNVRLLFVDHELVRHVMLHELCHTARMDHSRKFWALLERYDPDWHEHRRRLRAEWKSVPGWLTASPAHLRKD